MFPQPVLWDVAMKKSCVSDDVLDPQRYVLWTPPAGSSIEVGAERSCFHLPALPLPLHRADLVDNPTTDAIGRGLYDYLRQFPECPHGAAYAELLRDAFPHYIADLAAQIVMLEHKEVEAPYVQRKLSSLKILALLEPGNPALLQQIGMVQYELGLTFSQLPQTRSHLLSAMGTLQRSLQLQPLSPAGLNLLGQIDFLFGDYPSATRRWQQVTGLLEDGPARRALQKRIDNIAAGAVPDHPLVDDLEAIGEALLLYGNGCCREAAQILDRLAQEGAVVKELPSAEFFYLLGVCRGKSGDADGASDAFERALSLDADYAPALEAKARLIENGRL